MGQRRHARNLSLTLVVVAALSFIPTSPATAPQEGQSATLEAAPAVVAVEAAAGEGGAATGAQGTVTGLSTEGNSSTGGKSYSADSSLWVWPTANDPNAENLIQSILTSWCGDTYVDAVKDASEKAAEFDKLRTERDQRYADSIRCNQERGIRERELEMECARSRQVQASSFERERERIQTECDAEATQLKADLDNCDVKLKKKGLGMCARELGSERSSCDSERRELQGSLHACQDSEGVGNVSRVVALEETALRQGEERTKWGKHKRALLAEVNECRPAQSKARKRLTEVLTDGKVGQLESKVMWLQIIVLNLLLLTAITAGLLTRHVLKESRGDVEGGHGWIQTMPPSRLQLLDAEAARSQLVEAFEDSKGSRLAIALATDIFYGRRRSHTGPNTVFLLVPINITSARRFQLFNKDGDYTAHVERARDIVNKSVENPRLLVVLYEAGGCVFTEATLQSLRLTADKVAHEAIPEDMEFPASDNLVVLWLDKQEGLRASDSTQESDAVTDNIKCQPWAQYLLMRSGRWGQVHAQFM